MSMNYGYIYFNASVAICVSEKEDILVILKWQIISVIDSGLKQKFVIVLSKN